MAFNTFIQIDGVKGESLNEKHKDWIEVFSFSHGQAQQGSGVISQNVRTAGKADHHDFTVTKKLDSSSPMLNKKCSDGTHYPKVVVEVCKNTGNQEVFMRYTFEHVVVSSINIGGGQGQEIPTETVSFQYAKIKWEYTKLDNKTGKTSGNFIAEWDVSQNKGS